jgi:RNA polymerase sigma factor (sigma-70 family)
MPALDADALGQLYRKHAPALRLYARQWPDGGDDLVHDAFVRLAQQSVAPTQVVPWLYRVVRSHALAAGRSAGRRRRREAQASAPEAWFTAADELLDAGAAARLVSALALELREVIVARIWGGLTFDEVAHVVGCSLPTAHRRYQSGLKELEHRLTGQWTPSPTRPVS